MDAKEIIVRGTAVELLEERGFKPDEIHKVKCKTNRKNSAVKWAILAVRSTQTGTHEPRSAYENTLVVRLADHVSCKLSQLPQIATNAINNCVTDKVAMRRAVLIADHSRIRTKTHVCFTAGGVRVRLFPSSHMLFNIIRHRSVPRHTPLGKTALQQLADNYNTGLDAFIAQLPAIGENDPVCRFLGGTPPSADDPYGTVYHIRRLHGEETYRRVIGDFGV